MRACWCLASLLVVLVCLTVQPSHARGPGLAFPIDSENFAIATFQRTNPTIEWDHTNFLVDLSGHHAHCRAISHHAGVKEIHRRTPTGETIVAAVDFIEGSASNRRAIDGYIKEVIKRWETTNQFYAQIKAARRVGCSVRPGCSGQAVVACLFSPAGSNGDYEQNPTEPPAPIVGDQKALAFTRQQYSVAENIMGRKWDRSHYLENLSGFETDCSMVGSAEWPFSYTTRIADMLRLRITGQHGYARNLGSTPDALRTILSTFKHVSNAKEVGCSIIPDCVDRLDSTMYVVITCLYEEE